MLQGDAFARFLGENQSTMEKSNIVMDMDPTIAMLPWSNNKNIFDCGIYTMRHMETFKGIASWDCGLSNIDVSFTFQL